MRSVSLAYLGGGGNRRLVILQSVFEKMRYHLRSAKSLSPVFPEFHSPQIQSVNHLSSQQGLDKLLRFV